MSSPDCAASRHRSGLGASATRSAPGPARRAAAPPPPSTTGAMKMRSSSTSPAREQRAGERRAALDAAASVIPRRPSSSRASAEAALAVAGELDHLGARVPQRGDPVRIGTRGRRARRAAPRRPSARAPSPAAAGRAESKTTRAGWRTSGIVDVARRQQRVVGERGADPDGDGVGLRAPAVHERRGSRGRRSTCESPLAVAVKPSRLTADLSVTSGRPVRACLRKGWFSSRAAAASAPSAKLDLDPLVAQDARAAAGGLLARVLAADHHPGDPGGERSASVHGGWRPWCAQGSSDTYIVAPAGSFPRSRQSASAATSAWTAAEPRVMALADHLAVRAGDHARRRAGSG